MIIKMNYKDYIHEYVLITLKSDIKIKGYIEDYNKPLRMYMVFDLENYEYLFISNDLIKSIEVIENV
jgi:hypothetical protein